eukprot:6188797-Pleurochrysis_carterae.AAC.4
MQSTLGIAHATAKHASQQKKPVRVRRKQRGIRTPGHPRTKRSAAPLAHDATRRAYSRLQLR